MKPAYIYLDFDEWHESCKLFTMDLSLQVEPCSPSMNVASGLVCERPYISTWISFHTYTRLYTQAHILAGSRWNMIFSEEESWNLYKPMRLVK